MAWMPPVPERFGEIGLTHGLMFTCEACTRGRTIDRAELVKRWGEEGRVADVVARFRCSNCASKRQRRRAGVRVQMVQLGDMRTASERRRDEMSPLDRLVADIQALKVSRID
jgi:hypothetical protein